MIATRFLVIALMNISVAFACECSEPTVLDAKQQAIVVFRGTISALRPTGRAAALYKERGDTGKIAVFRVSRVWKGEVGQTFEMPAVEEAGGCWGFDPQVLKVGADLIVYAQRLTGKDYQTSICSRTRFVKYAAKDFKELGPGEEPKPATGLRNPNSK